MRYCSSSLFSSSRDQIERSSCISWCRFSYFCIEYCLLLGILSSSSLISSFVVSIAHLRSGWPDGRRGHKVIIGGEIPPVSNFYHRGKLGWNITRSRYAHSPPCDPSVLTTPQEMTDDSISAQDITDPTIKAFYDTINQHHSITEADDWGIGDAPKTINTQGWKQR